MLSELKVSQFAIIDQVNINFEQGLNIISGETGAGKSIILKCLSMLMGQKTSINIIKQGSSSARVIGSFDLSTRPDIADKLEELGVSTEDNQLIVRRVLSSSGKNKVYLNDNLTTLNTLKKIVSPLIELTNQDAPLIEMTAQHENKNLQSPNYQLDLLDAFSNTWDLRADFLNQYKKYKALQNEIDELINNQPNHEQRLDFLKYQLNEINNLHLRPGEEKGLEEKINVLKNSHHLIDYLNDVETGLYSSDKSCLVLLHNLIQKSSSFNDVSSELLKKLEPLKQAKTLIEETLYDIRDYSKNITTNPQELDQLEVSLTALRKLQRKYGKTIQNIFEQKEEFVQEIEKIENFDQHIEELKNRSLKIHEQMSSTAKILHQKRKLGAKLFEQKINEELLDLNMKGVNFLIQIVESEEISTSGMTKLDFLIKQNKKDSAKPISKVASGGELSRILLSIKKVTGNIDKPRTFLFDEVDTGVSGPTAEKVGKKLKDISEGQQVICVTHLPQVAAFSDHHFLIEKKSSQNKTHLDMKKLTKKEKVDEIARLISGEKITKTSLAHAKQLLRY